MTLLSVHDRYSAEEIDKHYDDGFWLPETFAELVNRQAEELGDKPFIHDSTTSISYRELRDRSIALARALRTAGIGKSDRVAIQTPSWTEFAVVTAALATLGAVLVPIMPVYRGKEVEHVLKHSGAKMVMTAHEFKGFDHLGMFLGLREEVPAVGTVVAIRPTGDDLPEGAVSFDDFIASGASDTADFEPVSPDEPMLIVYTSGTTSAPKGCVHTLNTARSNALTLAECLDYTADDVQFNPSPIAHSTGLVTGLLMPLAMGASSHLMEAWEPDEGMRRIHEHGCTVAFSATAFLQMMMSVYDPDRHDVSCIRAWVAAGAPIPGSVVENSTRILGFQRVLSLFGRSENFTATMCTPSDPVEKSSTSDGHAVPGAQVKIVDPFGDEVGVGEEGDIAYKGPSHMLGYHDDPEQTAELFTDEGYSRSGDLGMMDSDGFVRVTGRLKDIVIRGGMNISAREIEDLLLEHPQIANVAVVGMPDERLGEKVCAFATTRDGKTMSLTDITDYLRSRDISVSKLPERLEVVEEFPMTATGKIQKHLLRKEIAARLERESSDRP